uniref:Activin_recp domain-containing protein n=1 Tax=Strongyloides papillosus TaxID=174720 RepID=A0A0N5BVY1_STREA
MYSRKYLLPCIFLVFLIHTSFSLTCYDDYLEGADPTTRKVSKCEKENCYRFTIKVDTSLVKTNTVVAGCSTYRCKLANTVNKCETKKLEGTTGEFCCCNTDRCN